MPPLFSNFSFVVLWQLTSQAKRFAQSICVLTRENSTWPPLLLLLQRLLRLLLRLLLLQLPQEGLVRRLNSSDERLPEGSQAPLLCVLGALICLALPAL